MPTKTELIAQVNREFPNHFMELQREIPATSWPIVSALPVLTRIEVETTGQRCALLRAHFSSIDDKEYEVAGGYSERALYMPYVFTERIGHETMIEREVLRFLLVDICGEQAPPCIAPLEYWRSLAN